MSKMWIDYSISGAVDEKIRNGLPDRLKGRKFGFLDITYNNLGEKKRKGYVQFTTSGSHFIYYCRLVEIGIYPDPNVDPNTTTCASRVRKDWSELE